MCVCCVSFLLFSGFAHAADPFWNPNSMFVNGLHNFSLDFQILTTIVHSSKIVKMSVGKLKANFGANISSMFLSETIL